MAKPGQCAPSSGPFHLRCCCAGAVVIPFLVPLLAQAEESAIAALGASKFDAEFKAGKAMSRGAAIDLALGEPARVAAVASDDQRAEVLGKRQAEVARLVADGLSNKQIGSRLSYPSARSTATSAAS